MGRYTKKYVNSLENLRLHKPSEHNSTPLKTCGHCNKQAITDDELKLFCGGKKNLCLECKKTWDNATQNPKHQKFGRRQVPVLKPRTGICQKCGVYNVDITAPLHHYKYSNIEGEESRYSIELCTKCHPIEDANRERHEQQIRMLRECGDILSNSFGLTNINKDDEIERIEQAWIKHYENMKPPTTWVYPKMDDVMVFFDGGIDR